MQVGSFLKLLLHGGEDRFSIKLADIYTAPTTKKKKKKVEICLCRVIHTIQRVRTFVIYQLYSFYITAHYGKIHKYNPLYKSLFWYINTVTYHWLL